MTPISERQARKREIWDAIMVAATSRATALMAAEGGEGLFSIDDFLELAFAIHGEEWREMVTPIRIGDWHGPYCAVMRKCGAREFWFPSFIPLSSVKDWMENTGIGGLVGHYVVTVPLSATSSHVLNNWCGGTYLFATSPVAHTLIPLSFAA